jgi:hypothetical protein
VAKLTGKLVSVKSQASRAVVLASTSIQGAKLPLGNTRNVIEAAVEDAQVVLPPSPAAPPAAGTPTPTTAESPANNPPATDPATSPTAPQNTGPTPPPSTTPTTTGPPPTVTSTTVTQTTDPPPTTTATPDSGADQARDTGDLAGADEQAPAEAEDARPDSAP